jgi:peptide/nickel transport system ATP-binding protein
VSLDIYRGQFFGLVGESGSGKTTLGRALLKAAPITAGNVVYRDEERGFDVQSIKGSDLKDYRKRAQLIFQDPYAALSPRMTVRDIIAEPLEVMKLTRSRKETDERVREIAAKCRLNLEHLRRFPHAFSGGQRQRISIARALVSGPRFVVADESVAALDVSIQADVLNLLKQIQRDMGIGFLFISHDLSVVAHVCDQVAVMYLGQLVETAPTRAPLRAAPPSLHLGAPLGDPVARSRRAEDRREARGRDPVPRRAAPGLQVPHPLPLRAAPLPPEGPRAAGTRPRPQGRLPLREEFDFTRAAAAPVPA